MKKKLIPLKDFTKTQLNAGENTELRGGIDFTKTWSTYHTITGDPSNPNDNAIDSKHVDYCISL